jgi:hypothetical protein
MPGPVELDQRAQSGARGDGRQLLPDELSPLASGLGHFRGNSGALSRRVHAANLYVTTKTLGSEKAARLAP